MRSNNISAQLTPTRWIVGAGRTCCWNFSFQEGIFVCVKSASTLRFVKCAFHFVPIALFHGIHPSEF